LHRLVLMELVEAGEWSCKNLAFQGGTSLHLVWESPRYSEDLDFVVAKDSEEQLVKSMERVQRKVQAWMAGQYPDCKIELKNRSKPSNAVKKFDVVWTDKNVLGTVRVCAEFYAIARELVQAYSPLLKQVDSQNIVRLHATIPAAQREWLYHDKLHAIADRPYLKWRDLFDVWWLRTQSKGDTGRGLMPPWERDDFWKKSKVVNAMYGGFPEGMIPGIDKFLMRSTDEVVAAADKDLAPFLPPKLWDRLKNEGMILKIVEMVKSDLELVKQTILLGEGKFQPKAEPEFIL
jgi:predicted nucleotidyltransferase component of viral defense system